MFDSRVITEYLDTMSPVGKLIPASGRERAEVKTWEALADGLLDAAIKDRSGAYYARAGALLPMLPAAADSPAATKSAIGKGQPMLVSTACV